jgi:hypothetical protein
LNFCSLRRLAEGEMVSGLPQIDHIDQVCDSCLVRKQKHALFPLASKYRAVEKLELVHSNLCNSVMPASPGGKCLFLLLVDDASRYMWLMLLATKDGALSAFSTFQA